MTVSHKYNFVTQHSLVFSWPSTFVISLDELPCTQTNRHMPHYVMDQLWGTENEDPYIYIVFCSEHGGGMCTSPAPVTTSHLGRFCGRRLNCYTNSASNTEIYSSFLPFIVMVTSLFWNLLQIFLSNSSYLPPGGLQRSGGQRRQQEQRLQHWLQTDKMLRTVGDSQDKELELQIYLMSNFV